MDRRRFVNLSAGLAVASLASREEKGWGAEPVEVIDAHTHFYDPTRLEGVPWPSKDDKTLYRRVMPAEFKEVARPVGVTGTIVIEASPWLGDNQWLLDLAKDDPFLLGVVGHLQPGTEMFDANLRRFAANPKYRGIRIGVRELTKREEETAYLDDLRRLADHDLELDVNGGPETPAAVARLARRLPNLRIVINHVGNVRIDGKAPPEAWLTGMKEAAARPNVWCKVSSLVGGTGRTDGTAPRDAAFYRPVLDPLWAAFGDDRLIYASDWPVSERFVPYAAVHGIVREYVTAKGPAAARKFFSQNARVAYKLPG